jgi:hypothetical protein
VTRVSVDREDLQVLLDLAVNSLDFGSGFWENSDVPPVRRIAQVLGVDPAEVTPYEFQSGYPHAFVMREGLQVGELTDAERQYYADCRRCGKPEWHPAHDQEST